MKRPRCDHCWYWEPVPVVGRGKCRRYPGRGAFHRNMGNKNTSVAAWPIVGEKDWCGEWERHPDAANIEAGRGGHNEA